LRTDGRPDRDLLQRIDDDLRELLSTHAPIPLDAAVVAQFDDIRERFRVLYNSTSH
jgi:hypothetical protein